MLAAGAVFLSCFQCVRATGYALAPPSISECDIWRIDDLLTVNLYQNGCIPSGIPPGSKPSVCDYVGEYLGKTPGNPLASRISVTRESDRVNKGSMSCRMTVSVISNAAGASHRQSREYVERTYVGIYPGNTPILIPCRG